MGMLDSPLVASYLPVNDRTSVKVFQSGEKVSKRESPKESPRETPRESFEDGLQ